MKRIAYCMLGAVSLLLLQGCKDDTIEGFDSEPTKAKVALLNFASPLTGAPNYGYVIKLDGKRKFDAPLGYGLTTGYFTTDAGDRAMSLDTSRANLQTATPEGSVYSLTPKLAADKYYSILASGPVQKPDVIFLEDDITRPAARKLKIRFVNLSPDSPLPVNIYYRLASEPASAAKPLFPANSSYKQVANFLEIDPGIYFLEVRNASGVVIPTNSGPGSADPTVDPAINNAGTLSTTFQVALKEYKIYTLMLRGYTTPAGATANGNRGVFLSTVINRYW